MLQKRKANGSLFTLGMSFLAYKVTARKHTQKKKIECNYCLTHLIAFKLLRENGGTSMFPRHFN